ncbi:hypothetical protein HYS84_03670 [Candidatus Saccharibacteria bacterium]|nr:hypothetical protein [Candidatus Saccharibacteria bacterium]
MAKKIHPLALEAAKCFLSGDQAAGRRRYRQLGARISKRELKRQMSAAKAEVRLGLKEQTQTVAESAVV